MAVVVSDGSRIEYEVAGDGPPLVLLHGFFGDRSTWPAAGYVDALALADASEHSPLPELDAATVPVLLLVGDRDPRLELVRATGGRLTRAQIAVLPGCGHFDTFARRDLTVPLAREFLGQLRP